MDFFISDLHFGHERTCAGFFNPETGNTCFTKDDGTPLRPWHNAEEMNEALIANWNDRVKEQDKVYVLGDVCLHPRFLPLVGRLNGSKRLVRGNHDEAKTAEYLKYFKEVYGAKVLDKYGFILTHVPVHESCVDRFKVNVHGHLHDKVVMGQIPYEDNDGPGGAGPRRTFYREGPDPRYVNVSVEQINFAPISTDEIMALLETRRG